MSSKLAYLRGGSVWPRFSASHKDLQRPCELQEVAKSQFSYNSHGRRGRLGRPDKYGRRNARNYLCQIFCHRHNALADVHSPAPSAALKHTCVIGLGNRGGNIASNVQAATGAQALCFDAKQLEGMENAGPPFAWRDMELFVSLPKAAVTSLGKVETIFIVTTAASEPGSSTVLQNLVTFFQGAGVIVGVAIAMPFGFEGKKRLKNAEELLMWLDESASFVAVIEQDKLSSDANRTDAVPVTAAEATEIADMALEHTVRSVIVSSQASEVLQSSSGAMMWQSKERAGGSESLPKYLQNFLIQPHRAALGRGVAAMSSSLHQSMGDCQAMMQLASDAVRAAAQSPFLVDAPHTTHSALCCVCMASSSPEGMMAEAKRQDPEGLAAKRLAVQAAAGTLKHILNCDELILCYTHQAIQESTTAVAGAQHQVEVSLLALQQTSYSCEAYHPISSKAESSLHGEPYRSANTMPQPSSQTRPPVARLPASAWSAMSAIAGGSARQNEPERRANEASLTDMRKPRPIQRATGKLNEKTRRADAQSMITVSAKAGIMDQDDQISEALSAENLAARSLDLPPKAAKWRKRQRAKSEHPKLMVQAPEAAWNPPDDQDEGLKATLRSLLGNSQQEFDIRERTFAIVERDRGDSWEQDTD